MKLHLDAFEGPLDLLLFLIKKNNLEISRISIAEVTEQYLLYLETMKTINIDVASDFLVMAAELAHIKSKILLPKKERSDEDDDDEALESADGLVKKLKEYQLFKRASQNLFERALLGRDQFKKGQIEFSDIIENLEQLDEEKDDDQSDNKTKKEERYNVGAMDLLRAFGEVLKRIPKSERKHHVDAERVSVTDRIYEILDTLDTKEQTLFTDLFANDYEKIEYVVSFLAILEMGKLKLIRIFQSDVYGPIRVAKKDGAELEKNATENLAERIEQEYHS